MAYFGETPGIEQDAMAAKAGGIGISHPLSFLHPTTPYGDTYTPSYTKYLNSPGSSYNHPMFPLFNDRRPQAPKIRSTLNPGKAL